MVRYDRIESLIDEIGKTKRHLSKAMGHSERYLNDAKKQNTQICESDLRILAHELNTTVAYLLGKTDIKKEPVDNFDKFALSSEAKKIAQIYDDLDDFGKSTVEAVVKSENARVQASRNVIPFAEVEDLTYYVTPVSAGTGSVFDGWEEAESMQVQSNLYTRKATYVLTVTGDSMLPRFHDGDLVLVQEAEDIEIGEVGIFELDGKTYIKQKGRECLISVNPNYRDVYPDEFSECRCEGRVIGICDPDWIVK